MFEKEKQNSLNIPKKHTLRHYMRLVGKLYAENEELLEIYIEEQILANENNLDCAIACFKAIVEWSENRSTIEQIRSKQRVEEWLQPKK